MGAGPTRKNASGGRSPPTPLPFVGRQTELGLCAAPGKPARSAATLRGGQSAARYGRVPASSGARTQAYQRMPGWNSPSRRLGVLRQGTRPISPSSSHATGPCCQIEARDDGLKIRGVLGKLIILDKALGADPTGLPTPFWGCQSRTAVGGPRSVPARQRTPDAVKRLLLRESQRQPSVSSSRISTGSMQNPQAVLDSLIDAFLRPASSSLSTTAPRVPARAGEHERLHTRCRLIRCS